VKKKRGAKVSILLSNKKREGKHALILLAKLKDMATQPRREKGERGGRGEKKKELSWFVWHTHVDERTGKHDNG